MPDDAGQFWEHHYRRADRVWTGRVNARLAEVAAELPVGRALDLGCGEGADALWLAERGWRVVAVDVSATALERATADAYRRNLQDHVDFQCHDLSETLPVGTFDLVSAQYLQSPVRLDREAVLRRAADRVAPGGVLLVVDHGSIPPWAPHHDQRLPTVEGVLAALQPGIAHWTRVRAEGVEREMIGPEGEVATVVDNVVVVRRGL